MIAFRCIGDQCTDREGEEDDDDDDDDDDDGDDDDAYSVPVTFSLAKRFSRRCDRERDDDDEDDDDAKTRKWS